jgi:hypothetical protein
MSFNSTKKQTFNNFNKIIPNFMFIKNSALKRFKFFILNF